MNCKKEFSCTLKLSKLCTDKSMYCRCLKCILKLLQINIEPRILREDRHGKDSLALYLNKHLEICYNKKTTLEKRKFLIENRVSI